MTLTTAARDTATPPPRTTKTKIPAPTAEHFVKIVELIDTEALLALGISTDTPPPLLLEGTPEKAPVATVTEQLLNEDDCTLTFANATLLAYTAPPPPLDAPGTTDADLVDAEHAVKLQLEMENVKLNPDKFSAWGGFSGLPEPMNEDTWGECSNDKAPPYTEEVPRDCPAVVELAEQLENEQPVTSMRESWTAVVPTTCAMHDPVQL
jgi:hypothetical protein